MALIDLSEVATRYTVDEYEALACDPEWGGRRVELIHGVIVEMSPSSELHELTVERLLRWAFRNFDESLYSIRANSPLRVGDSEPQPDILVLGLDRPHGSLPSAAALVIEVAVSSIRRDTLVKPDIYAEAVAEYWVVEPEPRTVTVHRDPGPDGYRQVSTHGVDEMLAPREIQVLQPIALDDLFAAVA